jgi:hypothetical protein
MLVQLQEEAETAGNQEVPQDEADKTLAAAILQKLEGAETEAARICREQGMEVG